MNQAKIDRLLQPVSKFIRLEYTAGIVLLSCVVVAIAWANIAGIDSYHHTWNTHLRIGFGVHNFDQPLHVWINDGLMAVFFFVIGLELKREFIDGELSSVSKAALPMAAAFGGMIVPAFIYFLFNNNLPSSGGWGIPMATDIAFALGLLSLAGDKISYSIKVFLSALAVADDLGAVIVIAIFYTQQINFVLLCFGGAGLILLWIGNTIGIRHLLFYGLIGLIIWFCFLFSGVHATIAGVLIAFTIPARTKINENLYLLQLHKYAQRFQLEIPTNSTLTTPAQHRYIEKIKGISQDAETPLQKVEHNLHPWVAFTIMPLFALSNAGVIISRDFFSTILNPVSVGIITGLVIGKFIGVLGFSWLMIKWGPAALPDKSSWRHIVGIALLAGVGFTMSLFVTGLAFTDQQLIEQAKAGILLGSLISGAAGLFLLKSKQTVVHR
jgi:Na+:H+ antiporter, NhaA family